MRAGDHLNLAPAQPDLEHQAEDVCRPAHHLVEPAQQLEVLARHGKQRSSDVRGFNGTSHVLFLTKVSCGPQELEVPAKHPVTVFDISRSVGKVVLLYEVGDRGGQGELIFGQTRQERLKPTWLNF